MKYFLYGENKASWGIFIFAFAGIGILFVAGINYVNLSTARSIDRAREVGIRKTGGASRWQLIKQFLFESLLITSIAVCFSIVISEITLPYFNNRFDSDIMMPYSSPFFWIFVAVLTLGIGILAGFYPAFMLSSFQPSLILKNFIGGRSKGSAMRKVLVVSQFTITLFFIIFTIFMYRQISYLDHADLGVDKENLIYIPSRGHLWDKYEEIKGELLNESYIKGVTTASELPTDVSHGEIDWGKEKERQNAIARLLWCGDDALDLFGLELVSGRFYNKEIASDLEEGIVVNEEIIKMLNYEGDPIGQRFRLWDHQKTIIGVVKNFTFFPIEIGAKAIILPYRNVNQFIFVKTWQGIDNKNLAGIESILKKHNPNYPFEYYVFSDYQNQTLIASNKMIPILFYFSHLESSSHAWECLGWHYLRLKKGLSNWY